MCKINKVAYVCSVWFPSFTFFASLPQTRTFAAALTPYKAELRGASGARS